MTDRLCADLILVGALLKTAADWRRTGQAEGRRLERARVLAWVDRLTRQRIIDGPHPIGWVEEWDCSPSDLARHIESGEQPPEGLGGEEWPMEVTDG